MPTVGRKEAVVVLMRQCRNWIWRMDPDHLQAHVFACVDGCRFAWWLSKRETIPEWVNILFFFLSACQAAIKEYGTVPWDLKMPYKAEAGLLRCMNMLPSKATSLWGVW